MKHYYRSFVKDGKFKLRSRTAFDTSIKHYRDGEYLVALYKITDKTTREWQEFYFVTLGGWSEDVGYTKEELHGIIKSELFPELFDGETSTTQLSNTQWNILFLNLIPFLTLKFENK
jgi:hypothetical protein